MSPMQAEPYFWEEGGNPNIDWWAKVKHTVHFGSIKAIAGAEAVGEVSAPLIVYFQRVLHSHCFFEDIGAID